MGLAPRWATTLKPQDMAMSGAPTKNRPRNNFRRFFDVHTDVITLWAKLAAQQRRDTQSEKGKVVA